jgi:hypothetical protein
MSVDEGSPPLSPQYEELVEVVTRAVAKLDISWPPEETSVPQTFVCMSGFCARGKKQKNKKSLYIGAFGFFPDLRTEVSRSRVIPTSSRPFVLAAMLGN